MLRNLVLAVAAAFTLLSLAPAAAHAQEAGGAPGTAPTHAGKHRRHHGKRHHGKRHHHRRHAKKG